jgi:EAL domain-containing protein (putative c-di-GMP-specific phosphodiesterase class I)
MYQAKMNGRSRYEIFDKGMHLYLVSRLKLETELRRAIDNNEFELYYQPIVVLNTMKIIGFEALVRWKHPEKGIIGPLEFISVAEDTSLIISLGEWIINEACRQLSLWQEQFQMFPPLSVSVNISSKQFNPELVDTVSKILNMTGVIKGSIIFEITESMIMENAKSATVLMNELKKLGIKLHIDDFGTGYSSLSYLHHFPLDALKIDRSFIKNMGIDGENMEIVKTITDLANNLNLEVIAEGVETDYQLSLLKTLECENLQGFLISKPMNSEAAKSFLIEKLNRKSSK